MPTTSGPRPTTASGSSASMISRVAEQPGSRNLTVNYVDETGALKEEEFDLVVLSVGMVPAAAGTTLAKRLGSA